MSRRLPPLNALKAFEAAARHLSLVAGPWLLEYDWQVTSDIILPSWRFRSFMRWWKR